MYKKLFYSFYDLSLSWMYLPCLSRSVISLSWPSFCDLRTFFRLFDVMIVSRKISWLYFVMFSHGLFLIILHISAYSLFCLLSPFPSISRRFVIRVRVGDDILDFWIMYLMISLKVSMSSSSCSVSNWCLT